MATEAADALIIIIHWRHVSAVGEVHGFAGDGAVADADAAEDALFLVYDRARRELVDKLQALEFRMRLCADGVEVGGGEFSTKFESQLEKPEC